MKKIKTLIISFSIILILSIGGAYYFNTLAEELNPQILDDCFWTCNGLGDGCPSDELEYKACYEKNEEVCQLCKAEKGLKASLAKAKQEKYYDYMYSLIYVS